MTVPYNIIQREIENAADIQGGNLDVDQREAFREIALALQVRILEYHEEPQDLNNPRAISIVTFVTHVFMCLYDRSRFRDLSQNEIRGAYQLTINILQEVENAEAH